MYAHTATEAVSTPNFVAILNRSIKYNVNFSRESKDERRLDLKIDISYDADLKKAKLLIERILTEEI